MSPTSYLTRLAKERPILVWLFLLAVSATAYISQYWSPSSYGLVLERIGVSNSGLIMGEPRPIRSDEWSVVTPLTQATVNNDFKRYNATSLYHEDLRINYGLPIFDWGMLFKPTMWGYLVAKPARAYSAHWFAILALFVLGYGGLFYRFGFDRYQAAFLSLGLYYTGFTQFWWNEKGPIFAFFPWVILAVVVPWPRVVRLALFYWLLTSWLLTNFYPPIFLSLAFVGALLIAVLDRQWFRVKNLLALGAVGAAAAVTAALYLKDYLISTSKTSYPGSRSVGGGSVSWQQWLGQIFPAGTFDWHYNSVIGLNICEVGVVGSALTLMVLVFLDYSNFRKKWRDDGDFRVTITILGVGALLMNAWVLLPLPAWAGYPLLWNHVQPGRMLYASGFLLMLMAAIIGRDVGLVTTWTRQATLVVLVVLGWAALKLESSIDYKSLLGVRSNDLIAIPVVMAAIWLQRKTRLRPYTVMIASSALIGGLLVFRFNPIQSSKAIFARHDTPFLRKIAQEYQAERGYLAVPGMGGATLNGLGFASVSHVTAVPALDFWRKKYPAMPEDQFLSIFNRYSHISLTAEYQPHVIAADNVGVPLRDFAVEEPATPKDQALAPKPLN